MLALRTRKCSSLHALTGRAFQVPGTHMKSPPWSTSYLSQWPTANVQGEAEEQVSYVVMLPQKTFPVPLPSILVGSKC